MDEVSSLPIIALEAATALLFCIDGRNGTKQKFCKVPRNDDSSTLSPCRSPADIHARLEKMRMHKELATFRTNATVTEGQSV